MHNQNFHQKFRKTLFASAGILVLVLSLSPLFGGNKVEAAQITSRTLTMSSASPSSSNATTTYTLTFTVPSSTVLKSFSADACTTSVGTCTTPTGFSVSSVTIDQPTNLGDASGWTVSTATAGSLRLSKSGNTAAPTGSQTVVFKNVQNPTTANTAFYLRMTTYSDASWSTAVDTGTVAGATAQTLTINAAVAEVLNFCVGATSVNDATTSVATDCTGVSGTSINIGTLDTSAVNISPVSTNGGDGNNAVAMIRTNAASGASITYDAVQQSGTNHKGTLRISGASCNAGNVTTDQCIDAAGTTQAAFTAGTEKFGMTIAGVNCGSTTSYSCTYASGTNNLQQSTDYVGGANSTTFGASAAKGFAWDETGTAQTIATSGSSTTKTIDDEALIIKFAATPSITTPFGSYAAQVDFVAVPTY